MTFTAVLAFGAAFLGAMGFWWMYFDRSADAAAEVIADSDNPGALGRSAYHLVHPVMIAGIIVTAAAAVLTLGSASAFAWSQHGTAYTSRGTYNGAHYGSCGAGSCSHAGGVAGPYGGIATNSGTVTRTGTGQFSNSGTATGRYGNSVQHAGDTSCAGGTCSHTGTLTGQDGKTASTDGSVTRNAPGQQFKGDVPLAFSLRPGDTVVVKERWF